MEPAAIAAAAQLFFPAGVSRGVATPEQFAAEFRQER
jgi:hypothetical protein